MRKKKFKKLKQSFQIGKTLKKSLQTGKRKFKVNNYRLEQNC